MVHQVVGDPCQCCHPRRQKEQLHRGAGVAGCRVDGVALDSLGQSCHNPYNNINRVSVRHPAGAVRCRRCHWAASWCTPSAARSSRGGRASLCGPCQRGSQVRGTTYCQMRYFGISPSARSPRCQPHAPWHMSAAAPRTAPSQKRTGASCVTRRPCSSGSRASWGCGHWQQPAGT
jgi:hypothetical protein